LAGVLAWPGTLKAQMRVDGLASETPAKLLIFTVRGEGVVTPLISFQEKTRATVEAHMHVRVISMDETLAAGGAAFQKRLADCKGDATCYQRLVGAVDAKLVLVITASLVGDLRLVGSRLIDLVQLKVLGEAADAVPEAKGFLDVVPDRIRASVPPDLWDPFGGLSIAVNQGGAQISVNGRVVGMSPLATLGYLPPGDYKIEASKQGFLPAAGVAKIERNKDTKIALDLQESAKEGSTGWLLWAGLGAVAVAGAIAAIVIVHGSGSKDATFCSAVSRSECP
jgi:hypothetical protein